MPRPGRFTLRIETLYQLYKVLGGRQGRSERGQKITSSGILSSVCVNFVPQIKNEWIYSPTTHMSSWRGQNNFIAMGNLSIPIFEFYITCINA